LIQGTNWLKEVPRSGIIAKYQGGMGYVDRHNKFWQGYLHLAKIWKTTRWQTRIQLELLGLTMVEDFLACCAQMPKWQNLDDEKSVFWQFVHTVIAHIDSRPMSSRVREGEAENSYRALQTSTFGAILCHFRHLQRQFKKQTGPL
jgi:hypothetical protein